MPRTKKTLSEDESKKAEATKEKVASEATSEENAISDANDTNKETLSEFETPATENDTDIVEQQSDVAADSASEINTDDMKSKASVEDEEPQIEFADDEQQTEKTADSSQTNDRTIKRLNLDNFGFISADEKKLKQKWDELYDNFSAKKTLQAEIVGSMGGGSKLCAVAKITNYEEFNVYIPYEELDLKTNNNLSDDQKNLIVNHSIGTVVSVIITRMLSTDEGMTASARIANILRRRKYFYLGVRTNVRSAKKVIGVNTIIKNARILRLYRESIDVDVCGAVTNIKKSDVFWQYVRHPKDYYHIGDTISVIVKKVTLLNDKDFGVKLVCSHKELEENTTVTALENVIPGTSYLGEVTFINETGKIFLYCDMGFNAIANAYRGSQMPVVGSKVKFRVKNIDNIHNLAFGIITQIIRLY